jgi:hypothetical protein
MIDLEIEKILQILDEPEEAVACFKTELFYGASESDALEIVKRDQAALETLVNDDEKAKFRICRDRGVPIDLALEEVKS